MKTLQTGKAVSRLATLTALVVAGLAPSLASANLASNTTVRNTVTVNYADASAVAQPSISDEVDVSITLVAATPTLNAPADQTIAPSSTAIYNYTVTTNANGPDTYNITVPVGTITNAGGVTSSTVTPSTASISLGATTSANAVVINVAATTDTTIPVPSDGVAGGGVNGLAVGETVIIGGVTCTVVVAGFSDPALPLTGAVTNAAIGVNCASAVAVSYGTLIREQRTFTVTADPTGWTPPGPGTITAVTNARDAANAQPAATDTTVTTVEQLLTVIKYVRNVTTPAAPAGPPANVTVGGSTYYASGVVGAPGETLEYLVEVTNTSLTNNATDTVISDPVPPFTTFNTTGFAALTNAGVATALNQAEDNDAGEVQAGVVYIYPGSTTHGDDTDGGTGNANGDGGTVAAGQKAYGRFRVVID